MLLEGKESSGSATAGRKKKRETVKVEVRRAGGNGVEGSGGDVFVVIGGAGLEHEAMGMVRGSHRNGNAC